MIWMNRPLNEMTSSANLPATSGIQFCSWMGLDRLDQAEQGRITLGAFEQMGDAARKLPLANAQPAPHQVLRACHEPSFERATTPLALLAPNIPIR